MKKIVGYLLFVLSFVAWGVITLLPSMDLTATEIASYTTALVVLGEVFFWLSLVLLGKDFMSKVKAFLKNIFCKKKE